MAHEFGESDSTKLSEPIKKTEFGVKKIPTYVFAPHNWAFYCWAEALKQGKIEKGATLIHMDTHFDGDYPHNIDYQKLDLNNLETVAQTTKQLSILDFIAPAQKLKLVDDVIWVSPREFDIKQFDYAAVVPHQEEVLKNQSFKETLAKLNNPKRLIVDVDIDYFMHGNTSEADFQSVREVMDKAGVITIATSPKPLTNQSQAQQWVNTLLRK